MQKPLILIFERKVPTPTLLRLMIEALIEIV